MRTVGTVVRGIRAPILQQGDDLAAIAVDSLLAAAQEEGFAFRDTNGIVSCDDGLAARLYENGEECVLLYASESDELKYVTLGFEAQITRAETLDGGEQATSFTGNKKTFLTLPPSRLGAIWLHK